MAAESSVRVVERRSVRDFLFVVSLIAVVAYVFLWVVVPVRKREQVLDARLRETVHSIRELEVNNRNLQAQARALVEDPSHVEYLLRREARYTRRGEKERRRR